MSCCRRDTDWGLGEWGRGGEGTVGVIGEGEAMG